MRAMPMLTPKPGTGRALPTPIVQSAIVEQTVDLKPAGNTVAIKTVADNPFESNNKVKIVTQASGGMSPAPASMTSRGILHSFLPGLGETSTEEKAKDPTVLDVVTGGVKAASDVFTAREQTRATQYQSKAAEMDAQARMLEAEAAKARAQADAEIARIGTGQRVWDATSIQTPMGKMNWGLILLGVGGLGLVAYLASKKRGGRAKAAAA